MATVSSAVRRFGIDAGRDQAVLHDVEHFVGHGIGDEGFVGEIGGLEPGLGGQGMPRAHQGDALVAEQRAEDHIGLASCGRE
jgi:hypothetical protein